MNRLKARDLFGTVKYKVLPGSSEDNSIIEIEVEEKPTGEIAAGAGVGTEGTSFTFLVNENNWLGRGVRLKASLDLTEESIRGGLAVNNPNYNNSGNAVSSSFQSVKTDRLSTSGYESTNTSFSLGTSFEQYRDIFISPNISASYEDVRTDSSASKAVTNMAGTYTNFDFGYGIVLDKRNQPFQATEGFRTSFIQKLPVYSDTPSLLNGLDYSSYHQMSEDVISTFRFYGRSINSLRSGEDVRITNRLYLPSTRLRGFKRGKLGPKDGTDHVGGNYAVALNLEASLPNLLPETTKTDISVFLDAANLWGVDYDETLAQSNQLRSSVGAAANMYTPIGPLSLTLAFPITKAETDKTEAFNFRLGTSF